MFKTCLPLALVLLLGCPPPPPPCQGGECPDLKADPPDAAPGDAATPPDASAADLRPAPDLVAGVPDPGRPGPRRTVRFDLRVPVAPGGLLDVTVIGPSEDGRTLSRSGAPFPVVIISPGFTLPRTQFAGYGERLASHGLLAVLQKARNETDHVQYRDDTIRLLDWLGAPTGPDASRLEGRADVNRAGVCGHSLGGKISYLVAARDRRIRGVIGIDPVDGGGFGMAPTAREALPSVRLPPGIAIGFLGQTISKSGLMPCTPADRNYEVLYAAAPAPAFAITFVGAAHNDFVDDFGSCFQCGFCPGSTAPRERTRDLAIRYVTAYFLKALAGIAGAEDYLSGEAFQRDVMSGAVTRQAK
ncbi:MAG: hypothetical protein RMK29_09930 [Myxococcales bacterium]|nr:hypothetical protein [Myxococcota bacterium]MDW8282021.1 hypothetical protein [Myxococcales bacterium]